MRGTLVVAVALLAPVPAWAALAFVTNQGDDTVSVVDTAAGVVVQTVHVGAKPAGVAVGPEARRIYVTNPEAHSVSILERTGARLAVVARRRRAPGRSASRSARATAGCSSPIGTAQPS